MNTIRTFLFAAYSILSISATAQTGSNDPCNVDSLDLTTGNLSANNTPTWKITDISNTLNAVLNLPISNPFSLPTYLTPVGNDPHAVSFTQSGKWISPPSTLPYTTQQSNYSMTFTRSFRVCTKDSFKFSNLRLLCDGSPVEFKVDNVTIPNFVPFGIVDTWTSPTYYPDFDLTLNPGLHTLSIKVSEWGNNTYYTNNLFLSFEALITSNTGNNSLIEDDTLCSCPLAVPEIKKSDITVMPNPAKNKISIIWPDSDPNKVITILDMTGKVIMSQQVQEFTDMDISSLANAQYIINAKSDGITVYTQKLLKE